MKLDPILEFVEVNHFLAPLHLQMGIFQQVFNNFKEVLISQVDDVTPEEVEMMQELEDKKGILVFAENDMTSFDNEHGADLNYHLQHWQEANSLE